MVAWCLLKGYFSVRLAGLVTMAKSAHSRTPDAGQIWEQAFPGAMEQAGQVRAALRPELRAPPRGSPLLLIGSAADLAGVPETTREEQVPVRRSGRGRAPVVQRGQMPWAGSSLGGPL
jgi:hypothetical protein